MVSTLRRHVCGFSNISGKKFLPSLGTQQKTRPVFGCTTAIVFNDFGCEWKMVSFEVLRKPPNCESEVAGIRGEIDGIQLIFNY